MYTKEELAKIKTADEAVKNGFAEFANTDRGISTGHAGKHYLRKGMQIVRTHYEFTDENNEIHEGFTWSCMGVPLGALRALNKVEEQQIKIDDKVYLMAVVKEDCVIDGVSLGNNRYRYDLVKG